MLGEGPTAKSQRLEAKTKPMSSSASSLLPGESELKNYLLASCLLGEDNSVGKLGFSESESSGDLGVSWCLIYIKG